MSTENGFCKEKKEDSDATSKETDFSLGRKLEELIECPVCKNVMYPPIQQCSSGHPLCSSCKSLVKRCPTCRQALGRIRCLVLEQMAESVDLPCGYEMFGCSAKLPYPSGLNHEKNCKHRPLKLFNCPYAVQGDACSFTDNIPSLVTHLTSDHNVVIYENCAFIGTYIGLDSQRPPISVWKIIVCSSLSLSLFVAFIP
ncbi:E3 ubiquitin-protein ligase SINAT2-like [Humulus lupulus]|uniref:E3 ubiquitin-protein ligase SINAT2-like n=1 Tax=Humulus lupulus TaxID=3486 RepID=UPI002B408CC3|nr:E3 ubiquitin-protein ligase SINAT2-like [Humulus lupulus]